MSSREKTVEVPLTLHISEEARELLARRAAVSGTDLAGYVSSVLEQCTAPFPSMAELSGPIYQRFLESGTTEDELAEELEKAKHELRVERRARKSAS